MTVRQIHDFVLAERAKCLQPQLYSCGVTLVGLFVFYSLIGGLILVYERLVLPFSLRVARLVNPYATTSASTQLLVSLIMGFQAAHLLA